jgi:hypothetical protein
LVRGSSRRCIEIKQRLRLCVDLFSSSIKGSPPARLAPDKDILRQRQVRHQVQFLVDHADPQVLRGARVRNLDFFALIENAPASLA